jgi:hypothetical protein
MLLHQGWIAGTGYGLGGWHGSDGVAEPVYSAAFDVYAAEVGCGAEACGFGQQGPGLRGFNYVMAEKDDAAGADKFEPGAFQAGKFGAGEAYD